MIFLIWLGIYNFYRKDGNKVTINFCRGGSVLIEIHSNFRVSSYNQVFIQFIEQLFIKVLFKTEIR